MCCSPMQFSRPQERLKQQKIDLHYTKEAIKLLGMLGFDPNFGAEAGEVRDTASG